MVANGWTFNGDGTATHNTATGQYSRIAIPNADMGDATDVVLTFDIPAQTSNNWSLGVRARQGVVGVMPTSAPLLPTRR